MVVVLAEEVWVDVVLTEVVRVVDELNDVV